MSIKKSNDLTDALNSLRSGVHPKWGYLPDSPSKRSLTIGKWTASLNGDIVYDDYYHIQKERFNEPDWIIHLMDKGFFDFNEFMPIYMQAHFNAGLKTISFNIFY
jgi:hypothetical protein